VIKIVAHVIGIDHLAAIAADLNQHRRLEVEAALVVVLDTIAVLLRRESGFRPLRASTRSRERWMFS
jgi:hypothetical protein